MIRGVVTEDGSPTIMLPVAGRDWPAVIDSGFNGDLELPEALRDPLNARFTTMVGSILAGGVEIVEEGYEVEFPFDGRVVTADVTFVEGDSILIGTQLLRDYRLEIDFVAATVRLERLR